MSRYPPPPCEPRGNFYIKNDFHQKAKSRNRHLLRCARLLKPSVPRQPLRLRAKRQLFERKSKNTLTRKEMPESGLDLVMYAIFARQRFVEAAMRSPPQAFSAQAPTPSACEPRGNFYVKNDFYQKAKNRNWRRYARASSSFQCPGWIHFEGVHYQESSKLSKLTLG